MGGQHARNAGHDPGILLSKACAGQSAGKVSSILFEEEPNASQEVVYA